MDAGPLIEGEQVLAVGTLGPDVVDERLGQDLIGQKAGVMTADVGDDVGVEALGVLKDARRPAALKAGEGADADLVRVPDQALVEIGDGLAPASNMAPGKRIESGVSLTGESSVGLGSKRWSK